jgi:hypothetical protein
MPPELPVLALIAVVAIASALAVFRRTEVHDPSAGHRASHAHRRGIVSRVADILDASAGMLMVRRLLGRSTVTRAEGREERERLALAAQVEARRAGGLGTMTTPPTRLVVAGTAATHSMRDLPDRQAHPVAAQTVVPVWTSRARVGPVAAMAAVGFVTAFVVVFAMWPRAQGGVLSATGTPELPSPTADLASATPTPTGSPTPTVAPSVVATPSPTATPTPAPAATATASPKATQTPRPTARPTSTPRPTARPTATPTPTPTVQPSTVPTPTPSPTPEVSPSPTPPPTTPPPPPPTATPTAAPTVAPTPTPASS